MEKLFRHSDIIEQPSNSKQLVLAGPGTGKTYSIIKRIKYLINNEGLLPTEILILSFSVAAIKEILKRIDEEVTKQECPERTYFINIRTFDSFASHLMIKLDTEIDLKGTYNERIDIASKTISENIHCNEYLNKYRHIIIDEVQDLVGVRAKLAVALLKHTVCGFTILGDPAQAIYGYLAKEEEQMTSEDFLNWLKLNFVDLCIQEQLKYNYRVGNNNHLLELAEKGRNLIFHSSPEDAYRNLLQFYNNLPETGTISEPEVHPDILNKSTVVLCRNNGQVLLLGRKLREQGIGFKVIRRKEDYFIPVWLANIFSDYDSQKISKETFKEKIVEKFTLMDDKIEEIWSRLKNDTDSGRGPFLDIKKLREMLNEKKYPIDDLLQSEKECAISISSIHRAKGREFENVIVVLGNEARLLNDFDKAEEAKILYVGITRAKKNLFKMSGAGFSGYKLSSVDRWIRLSSKHFLIEVEVGLEDDIDVQSSVSLKLFEGDSSYVHENVDFICNEITSGDEVRFILYETLSIPIYKIEVKYGENYIGIGLTSTEFGKALKEICEEVYNRRFVKYPHIIQKLWIKDIVTEVGNVGDERVPKKYRNTGLWPGIRIEGIGECIYK